MTKEQWQAIKNKDPLYDGRFVYVNRGTGTICKPSCSKRIISPENVILYETVEDALAEGYHLCKKCHPEYKDWKGARRELAEAVSREIRKNYMEPFSLDELADRLHINKYYMLRTFKEMTGETPLQYHNRCRCEKAKELLHRPELSVSYIAFETGYNSASHFSRKFRELTGITPSEYRKNYLMSIDE